MKILILVLSASQAPFKDILKAVKETWYSHDVQEIRKIFYHGNSREVRLLGDDLYLTDSEELEAIGHRTLNAFEHTKDLMYDYIVRVNAGSYINQENLLRFLIGKPRERFYCGIVGNYRGIEYASGSAYIVSRDVVERLIHDKNMIRGVFEDGELCVDDVAIGEMIAAYRYKIDRSALRISYCNAECEYQNGDNHVDFIPDHINYHYRLRSEDRQLDINRIYQLHEMIYGSS